MGKRKSFDTYLIEQSSETPTSQLPELFIDMDEVLVAFLISADEAFAKLGLPAFNDPWWNEEYPGRDGENAEEAKWEVAKTIPKFWERMKPMPEGKKLWAYVKKHKPHILSAIQHRMTTCKPEKMNWLSKHIGLDNIGTPYLVRRAEKKQYAKTNGRPNVLVDDYIKNIREWEAAGGIGILFKSASQAIAELKKLGY